MRRSPLWLFTLARLREFVREPSMLFWTFGFPLIITVALGVAFRTQGPPEALVAVVEHPHAFEAAQRLEAAERLAAVVVSEAEAKLRLKAGGVALVLRLPALAGGPVRYDYDPSRPEALATRALTDAVMQEAAGRKDALLTEEETVRTSGSRYIDWLVPGLVGMQLMSGSLWGMAWSIVEARQRKLLKRFMATPMRRRDYLGGHLLARLVFVAVDVPIILGFAYLAFDVAIHGSLFAIALIVLLGSAAFSGIGLLCAARAKHQAMANGLINLVQMPMWLLSGVFFSAARFPEVMQPVIALLPLTALNQALRAVINDGAPLASQAMPLCILAVWGVASFGVAVRSFRWS